MKFILLAIGLSFIAPALRAQADSTQPLYKRFPSVPPFKILLTDSSTYYTKNDLPKKTQVMIMIFNPPCEHCQHETEEIIKNIDKFKDIHIVMVTSMPFDSLRNFFRKYELNKYKNIIAGKDNGYFLITYYQLNNMPFLAFYNKKQELISVFEGSMPIPKILAEFEK